MVIGICDDEKNIRDVLEDKIRKIVPGAKIIQFSTGEGILLCGMKLDILFLDIQMPGKDGMEVARTIRKTNDELVIIFVTGAEEYVFQAFDVGAFNYLVKPISERKLKEVLEKAIGLINSRDNSRVETERASIIVSVGGTHTKVYVEDIVYAEVFNRKIVIHTMADNIEYYGKMTDLKGIVGENFFRPHRAYLVNMKYVEKYDADNIYLEKGKVLMAKQNYKDFVETYMRYSMKG